MRSTGRELAEREAAIRRGEEAARAEKDGSHLPRDWYCGISDPDAAARAFASLADNVRDYAIFLLDCDGIITFWGEGARLIKWWTKEQTEGSHLRMLYPDGGAEDGTAEDHLLAAAERGEYTGEGHRVRADGSTFWGGITLTALRDREDRLIGFVKVTRDLTAQRSAAALRESALTAAEEASQLKSQFLATVSHEIRTPLTAVLAYTDLMRMETAGVLNPKHHEYLDRIRSSGQHLLGLIEQLLDLSRADAGRLEIGRARVQAGKVVSQALMLVEPQTRHLGVQVVNAVSGAAAAYECWGAESRVRQIVLNLLDNAVKFTERGGRVMVSVTAAMEAPLHGREDVPGPWVCFRVEDTGRGIPPEHMDRIFDAFTQVDQSSSRHYGGSGLGLAISRRLARLMGGDLTVRSEPGVGSSFFLWLPAAPHRDGAAVASAVGEMGATSTLEEARDAMFADLERILHGYVARLRSDPQTPSAQGLPESELEDHLASFLADVAQSVGTLQLTTGSDAESVMDGTTIQRTIAERHGAQRARLGWSPGEVEREFEILATEIGSAIRRRVRRPRPEEVEEVIGVVTEVLQRARRISVAAMSG